MLAAVDIGSNTARLLIGTVDTGRVTPLLYVRRITRLKGGQTSQGLTTQAMARTVAAVKEFSEIILQHSIEKIRIVGTEALRTATNRVEFSSRLF